MDINIAYGLYRDSRRPVVNAHEATMAFHLLLGTIPAQGGEPEHPRRVEDDGLGGGGWLVEATEREASRLRIAGGHEVTRDLGRHTYIAEAFMT